MKGKTGLRLQGEERRERRRRYVILSGMNTAELFMRSQSETSKTVEDIVDLSSFSSFVFSERKAACKSQARALARCTVVL